MRPSIAVLSIAAGALAVFAMAQTAVPLGTRQVAWYLDTPAEEVSPGVYTLPASPAAVMIFRNGMRLKDCAAARGGACDYTLAANRVEFQAAAAPGLDDVLIFDYVQ